MCVVAAVLVNVQAGNGKRFGFGYPEKILKSVGMSVILKQSPPCDS